MVDLFTQHLSKKEQLFLFMKEKEFVRTSEVIRWGLENFSNRAERDARQLAEDGKIIRLDESEKRFRGFKTKEEIWKII